MTYKQIEASREARLWITQVIVPVIGMTTALVVTVPEFKEAAISKYQALKEKCKTFK